MLEYNKIYCYVMYGKRDYSIYKDGFCRYIGRILIENVSYEVFSKRGHLSPLLIAVDDYTKQYYLSIATTPGDDTPTWEKTKPPEHIIFIECLMGDVETFLSTVKLLSKTREVEDLESRLSVARSELERIKKDIPEDVKQTGSNKLNITLKPTRTID